MEDYDRREFLRLSLPGFLGVVTALPTLCSLATRANACAGRLAVDAPMDWDAFLEGVAKEAARQHLDDWNQDRYVQTIAGLAGRLHLDDPVLRNGMEQLKARLENGRVDFNYLEERVDFALCLVQFNAGETIRPHDHPGMTGMILCASGEIETANYDELPEPADADGREAGRCLLRRVETATLRQNDISTLTAKARNIHTLTARKVTQLVDIFTPPYDAERIEKSRWFELDPEARPGEPDLFEAKVLG